MPTIERMGSETVPQTIKIGTIKAGQCDAHGTIDPRQPATIQYKLCGCFDSIANVEGHLCSYCPDSKNPQEIMRISKLEVFIHPDDVYKPKQIQRVMAVCNSFECSDKHLKRFKVSAN